MGTKKSPRIFLYSVLSCAISCRRSPPSALSSPGTSIQNDFSSLAPSGLTIFCNRNLSNVGNFSTYLKKLLQKLFSAMPGETLIPATLSWGSICQEFFLKQDPQFWLNIMAIRDRRRRLCVDDRTPSPSLGKSRRVPSGIIRNPLARRSTMGRSAILINQRPSHRRRESA